MVRQPHHIPSELLAAVGQALPDLQDATDLFDDAAAETLGINRTDLRVLDVIVRHGSHSPSALADAAGLSRGAMTTALDRLEKAGLARRAPNLTDRRGLVIEATDEAHKRCGAIWAPLAAESARVLAPFTAAELAKVLTLLQESRAIHLKHIARVRQLPKATTASASQGRIKP